MVIELWIYAILYLFGKILYLIKTYLLNFLPILGNIHIRKNIVFERLD